MAMLNNQRVYVLYYGNIYVSMNLAAIHGICAFFVHLSFDQNVFFYMYIYTLCVFVTV